MKKDLNIFLFLLFFFNYCNSYPQNSIRCYHTLARPDRQLICPQARNSYCMKEVSNLPESLCGLTQYFGDRYALGQCVYKKCADECVEGQYEFTFAGQKYTRKRYCCNNDDLCNDAISNAKLSWGLLIGLFTLVIYMLL